MSEETMTWVALNAPNCILWFTLIAGSLIAAWILFLAAMFIYDYFFDC